MLSMKPMHHAPYQHSFLLNTDFWLRPYWTRLARVESMAAHFADDVLLTFIDVLNRLIDGQMYRLVDDRVEVVETCIALVVAHLEGCSDRPREFGPEEMDAIVGIIDHGYRELLLSVCLDEATSDVRFSYIRRLGYDLMMTYEGYRPFRPASMSQINHVRHGRYQHVDAFEDPFVCI